jgi:peroxiredoxin
VIYGIARRRTLRDHGWSVLVNSLRFGQEAPGFSLPSTSGNQTALADFKGKSDVVLVFYCYDWGSI